MHSSLAFDELLSRPTAAAEAEAPASSRNARDKHLIRSTATFNRPHRHTFKNKKKTFIQNYMRRFQWNTRIPDFINLLGHHLFDHFLMFLRTLQNLSRSEKAHFFLSFWKFIHGLFDRDLASLSRSYKWLTWGDVSEKWRGFCRAMSQHWNCFSIEIDSALKWSQHWNGLRTEMVSALKWSQCTISRS